MEKILRKDTFTSKLVVCVGIDMENIWDKLVLLGSCIVICFSLESSFVVVFSLLCALSVSGFHSYFQKKRVTIGLVMGYFFCFFIRSEFVLWVPFLCYDLEEYRKSAAVTAQRYGRWEDWIPPVYLELLVAVSAGVILKNFPILIRIEVILFSVMAVYLQYKTTKNTWQKAEFQKLRDDSEELQLLLKNRNKNLLEKQDYEVRVATLKERNRIAREIHDNVGHMLSRSILQVGALQAINSVGTMVLPLKALKESLDQAMNSIRSSVHNLHEESIDLEITIRTMIKEYPNYEIRFFYDMEEECDQALKYCFLGIVKEALSNMVRHSNATAMNIILREHPGFYQLIVKDNGTEIKEGKTTGIGLTNMKERVDAFDGRFSVRKEKGFQIFVTIPK